MDGTPSKERRQHPRVGMDIPVSLTIKQRLFVGQLRDISRGGLFVRTKNSVGINLGEVVFLEIGLQSTHARCTVQGCVVRSQEVGFAVQFEGSSNEFDEFMGAVESLQPDARPGFLASVLEPRIRVI